MARRDRVECNTAKGTGWGRRTPACWSLRCNCSTESNFTVGGCVTRARPVLYGPVKFRDTATLPGGPRWETVSLRARSQTLFQQQATTPHNARAAGEPLSRVTIPDKYVSVYNERKRARAVKIIVIVVGPSIRARTSSTSNGL